jgi:hypothetical protein
MAKISKWKVPLPGGQSRGSSLSDGLTALDARLGIAGASSRVRQHGNQPTKFERYRPNLRPRATVAAAGFACGATINQERAFCGLPSS